MRDVKKVLEMRSQNYSQRQISVSLKISRDTIRKIFYAADDKKICWSSVKNLSEPDVQNLLFEQEVKINLSIKQPDFDYIHKELLKPGTTIKLLWEEYVDSCRSINSPFYQYSYFCERYRDYVKKHNLTMHINHKPGDKMMVDWNGTRMYVYDRYTGEAIPAYLFEATIWLILQTNISNQFITFIDLMIMILLMLHLFLHGIKTLKFIHHIINL